MPPAAASSLPELLAVMAKLRSPQGGCPWDLAQDHRSLRFHAVEEVYELLDAIEANDDQEMMEELGDLLLQVVFHAQLASERSSFNFEKVTRNLTDKLIRRHPHVFGDVKVKNVDQVWANWEKIKKSEKDGTKHARPSGLDGIPRHLPALIRAEKLVKKARKAKLLADKPPQTSVRTKAQLAKTLFDLAELAQKKGWHSEDLLRAEAQRREKVWRRQEKAAAKRK